MAIIASISNKNKSWDLVTNPLTELGPYRRVCAAARARALEMERGCGAALELPGRGGGRLRSGPHRAHASRSLRRARQPLQFTAALASSGMQPARRPHAICPRPQATGLHGARSGRSGSAVPSRFLKCVPYVPCLHPHACTPVCPRVCARLCMCLCERVRSAVHVSVSVRAVPRAGRSTLTRPSLATGWPGATPAQPSASSSRSWASRWVGQGGRGRGMRL